MSARRQDLAKSIEAHTDLPVYDTLHDGVAIPSVVVYPASNWVTRGSAQTWCDAEWRYIATILTRRADLEGAIDLTEDLLEQVMSSSTPPGCVWEEAGDMRSVEVAGVDYVAVDIRYVYQE